jgi:hypothetical protein
VAADCLAEALSGFLELVPTECEFDSAKRLAGGTSDTRLLLLEPSGSLQVLVFGF